MKMTFCSGSWEFSRFQPRTRRSSVSVSHARTLPCLLEALEGLTDPRKRRGIRHRLVAVPAVAVVATLGGARNYREMGSAAEDFSPALLELLGVRWHPFRRRRVAAGAGTIRRVLIGVDADALDRVIADWLRACAACDQGGWQIALDGKDLHGAWDGDGRLVLFSALVHRRRGRDPVTLAQIAVPEGTTETTQVTTLLDDLDIDGALVTMDAAHTCAATARHLVDNKNADYLMAVKGNREALYAACRRVAAGLVWGGQIPHVVTETGHGRISTWTTWSTDLADGDKVRLPYAARLAVIRRDIADLAGQPTSKEIVMMVTSRATMTSADFHTSTRGHWSIENLEHRPRDTVWQEGDQQAYLGNGPRNTAALRNLALGALAINGITKITETVQKIGRHHDRAAPLLMLT
ncbi:ISAs1 family transposase [Spirillospora sp. NPDC048824]|uniref:ISAs1 family transposase n=1 Tax=Spirillospora sp. NPDC048824 TaxID=3364526 RepID=UPI0037155C84